MGERTARYAIIIDHGKVVYAEKEPGRDVTVSARSLIDELRSANKTIGLECQCGACKVVRVRSSDTVDTRVTLCTLC